MRKSNVEIWAVTVVLGALAVAPAAHAAPPDRVQVVFPTGSFPADVENVQAAVDGGGTVLLKARDAGGQPAAFDFGPSGPGGGFVSLTADVVLRGEVAAGHRTTVRGGFLPLRSLAPVRATIAGLHLDASGFVAINVGRSAGLTVVDNVITDVVPEEEIGEAIAVFVSNFAQPDAIAGRVTIAGNAIAVDRAGAAPFADGVVLLGLSADVLVASNAITHAHGGGIGVTNGRRVSIVGNVVRPGAGDPSVNFGNGIFVSSPLEGGAIAIAGNAVECGNPFADGVGVGGLTRPVAGASIQGNHVTMAGSLFGAISLYGDVSEALVAHNTIVGDGAIALQVAQGFDPADLARSNRLRANDLSSFSSSFADVFFDVNAHDNAVAGRCESVVDLGTDNHYGCGQAAAGGGPAARATGRRERDPSRRHEELARRVEAASRDRAN